MYAFKSILWWLNVLIILKKIEELAESQQPKRRAAIQHDFWSVKLLLGNTLRDPAGYKGLFRAQETFYVSPGHFG